MAAASSPVVTIYKNGDRNFLGKKIVVNRRYYRNFDNFLDKITQDTRAGVAVRKIHTPHHGTKVESLESIQDGATYVAAGSEKFRHLSYGETPKPASNSSSPITNHHSKTVAAAESRYKKEAMAEPLKNRIIFVYRNGEKKVAPVRLLVDKRSLGSMDVFLQFISDKIKLTGGAVKFLYSLDTMSKVTDVADIKTNMSYVAVGSGKTLSKGKYGEVPVSKGGRKKGEDGRIVNTGSTYTLPPPEDDKANVLTTPDMLSPLSNTYDADELKATNEVEKTDGTIENDVDETDTPSDTATPSPSEHAANIATQTEVDVTEINEEDEKNVSDPDDEPSNTVEDAASETISEYLREGTYDGNDGKHIFDPDDEPSNTVEEDATETISEIVREGTYDGNKVDDARANLSDDEEGGAENAVDQPVQSENLEEVTGETEAVAVEEVSAEETPLSNAQPETGESTESIIVDADASIDGDDQTAENEVLPETVAEDDSIPVETPVDSADENDEAAIEDEMNANSGDFEAATEQVKTPQEEEPEIPGTEAEVFKASGEQEESGEQIADDKNTTVEELIDRLPAAEVEEELPMPKPLTIL